MIPPSSDRPAPTQEARVCASKSSIPRWKRALDFCCIAITAPAWAIVGSAIYLIVKLVSPGPAFFKQERVGYRGKTFECLKFRTMSVNADTGVHQGHLEQLMTSNTPMTKLDSAGDKRVIPLGRVLRSLGLDELPQLLNVLRGDMSLVGPRPCLPYEYEQYLPRHKQRLATVPGLTGLWQVSGKNRTTFEEMVELDVRYAAKQSLFLDLKIILLTPMAIIQQIGDGIKRRKARFATELSTRREAKRALNPQP
jgi:exopolysaccharide production protein ExoY